MDKLDYQILSELLLDATLSFVEIAKKIGTSPYTVRRRYEKMKKDGVIFKHVVTVDLSKLGYQGKAFLFITTSPDGSKLDTISFLKNITNIITVTEILGPFDILAIAPVIDLLDVQSLVQKVREALAYKK